MLMFQKVLEEEAKKHMGQGLWQQLKHVGGTKVSYKALTIDEIQKAVGSFFNKKKPKRNRRKMKKHGKTI